MVIPWERHFTATEIVRHITIGISGGLVVPFALVTLLSGAVTSTMALRISVGVTLLVLGTFGDIKCHVTSISPPRRALQTLIGGRCSFAAALIIVPLIG